MSKKKNRFGLIEKLVPRITPNPDPDPAEDYLDNDITDLDSWVE